jgi:DmsE family decaheme c-type cytochrome
MMCKSQRDWWTDFHYLMRCCTINLNASFSERNWDMRMFGRNAKPRAAWLALILAACLALPGIAAAKGDKDDKDDKKGAPKVQMTAEEKDAAVRQILQSKLSKDGANTCVSCHDAENEYPVFPIFKTKHAVATDPRTPMANEQCESCHGPGGKHTKAKKNDKRGGSIINFGKNVWTPVKDQNEKCLACHQTHQRIQWKGSTHAFNDVACASCHKIHTAKDAVLDRQEQPKVCIACHINQQAKFFQVSHHPVREGQMACSECHDVHGEDGTGLKVKATAREKCASCHAEKRGPFLWEHAPAAEDCSLCHDPHGSNNPALLKKRVPQLCQECHSPSGHPSTRPDGSRLAGSMLLQVKGCLNCHNQVHGSNHPSGVTQLR